MSKQPSHGRTRDPVDDEVGGRHLAVWVQNTGTVHERMTPDATTTLCGRTASYQDEFNGALVRPCWTCVRVHVAAEAAPVATTQEQ